MEIEKPIILPSPDELSSTTPDLFVSLTPDLSWIWFAPVVLVPPVLYQALQRSVTERWQQLVPLLLTFAFSLALYAAPPTGRDGVGFLLLAVIASLATLIARPAFEYALDRLSSTAAILVASAVSIGLLFLFASTPLTGLGVLLAGLLGIEAAVAWPIAGLALFLFGLLTAGIGYALALFVDEIGDRMSSIVSGLFFGALLLLAGLAIGEAVAGGLLALALLQFIRIVPEKGVHMLLLFPAVAGALAVTAFTQAHPGMAGTEAIVLPLLVPALAVLVPFVLLEPQVLTRREGIAVVVSALVTFPLVSFILTRQMTIAGLNAFGPLYAETLAFEAALFRWGLIFVEVILLSLAFYLIVVMGLTALRRAKVQA